MVYFMVGLFCIAFLALWYCWSEIHIYQMAYSSVQKDCITHTIDVENKELIHAHWQWYSTFTGILVAISFALISAVFVTNETLKFVVDGSVFFMDKLGSPLLVLAEIVAFLVVIAGFSILATSFARMSYAKSIFSGIKLRAAELSITNCTPSSLLD